MAEKIQALGRVATVETIKSLQCWLSWTILQSHLTSASLNIYKVPRKVFLTSLEVLWNTSRSLWDNRRFLISTWQCHVLLRAVESTAVQSHYKSGLYLFNFQKSTFIHTIKPILQFIMTYFVLDFKQTQSPCWLASLSTASIYIYKISFLVLS